MLDLADCPVVDTAAVHAVSIVAERMERSTAAAADTDDTAAAAAAAV